jgi:hypothetical protein
VQINDEAVMSLGGVFFAQKFYREGRAVLADETLDFGADPVHKFARFLPVDVVCFMHEED